MKIIFWLEENRMQWKRSLHKTEGVCGVSLLNTDFTESVTVSTVTSLSSVLTEICFVKSPTEMYWSRQLSVKLSNDASISPNQCRSNITIGNIGVQGTDTAYSYRNCNLSVKCSTWKTRSSTTDIVKIISQFTMRSDVFSTISFSAIKYTTLFIK